MRVSYAGSQFTLNCCVFCAKRRRGEKWDGKRPEKEKNEPFSARFRRASGSWLGDLVADALDCFDESARCSELLAEVADVHVDRAAFAVEGVAPNGV